VLRVKIRKVSYKPVSVKKLLKDMRTYSSLMTDLAYTAFLYNNKQLAEEVMRLEELVDYASYLLLMNAALAVRDKDDAEQMAGIMKVASAVDTISNAAADIANLVLLGVSAHPLVDYVFEKADETVEVFEVKDHNFAGRTLQSLDLESKLGVNIIAVRKSGKWIVNPSDDLKLDAGDRLIARGSLESIANMERIFGSILEEEEKIVREVSKNPIWKKIGSMIEQLKDTTEFIIDLAYSALIFNSKSLAEEVLKLEDYIDNLHTEYELEILKETDLIAESPKPSLGLLRLGIAAENMADGAALMSEITMRGLEAHPILKEVVQEGEEIIFAVRVSDASSLANKKLGDTDIPTLGAKVIAVRRDKKWYFKPEDDFTIEPNDVLIISAYSDTKRTVYLMAKQQLSV